MPHLSSESLLAFFASSSSPFPSSALPHLIFLHPDFPFVFPLSFPLYLLFIFHFTFFCLVLFPFYYVHKCYHIYFYIPLHSQSIVSVALSN